MITSPQQADEEIYHQQLYFIHTLLTKLTKADMQHGNIGNLSYGLFLSTLQNALPGIDEEALAIIMKAVDTDGDDKETQEVDYKSFFTEVQPVCVLGTVKYRTVFLFLWIIVSVVTGPRESFTS